MASKNCLVLMYLIIISISSISNDEDLIDLTNYEYPSINDSYYTVIPILSTNDLHGGIFPNKYSDGNQQRYSNGGANIFILIKKY